MNVEAPDFDAGFGGLGFIRVSGCRALEFRVIVGFEVWGCRV